MTSPWTEDGWSAPEEPPVSAAQPGPGVLHTVPADVTPGDLVDKVIALEDRLAISR
jgi:hypothetical protein